MGGEATTRSVRDCMQRLSELDRQVDGDPQTVRDEVRKLVDGATDLDRLQSVRLRLWASSVLINAADLIGDLTAFDTGAAWAAAAANTEDLSPAERGQARYNQANAIVGRVDSLVAAGHAGKARRTLRRGKFDVADRLAHADDLRVVRVLYAGVGHDHRLPADMRSRALCNLGNTLDSSGRWLEAYEAYVDALDADPTNGNAAGNAAAAVMAAARANAGQQAHLLAVHDRFVAIAQANRDRTTEVAGLAATALWDQLAPTNSAGHFRHEGDVENPYQRWIVAHRLALATTVEGLSSNSGRFDGARVHSITTPVSQNEPPVMFGMLNVLKADYLAARRLAFRGEEMLGAGVGQHSDDTGVYTDTLDDAIYGEASATLVLAHRAALDVLDKVAVAANEHFQLGDAPDKVNFRSLWRHRGGSLRGGLVPSNAPGFSALALAELADDLAGDGLYSPGQALRNAGTHRLVRVVPGRRTALTKAAMSDVDGEGLVVATLQALGVCRAAQLYLIALIDESVRAAPILPSLPIELHNQL
jgi:tetratricopeptide (TPR) repeat protein